MTTLRDIASEVGVSVSLVSKVINKRLGTTGACEDVIRAIHNAAERLGYRKNASSVALLAGRHNRIGVFLHRQGTAGSAIIESLLDGIATEARGSEHDKQGLQLSFFYTDEELASLCEGAHRSVMDGLIVGGILHPSQVARLVSVRTAGLPVVTIYEQSVHRSLPNVGLDQKKVGQLATEHLIACGARRIAHVRNITPRFDGYRSALATAGLAYEEALVFDASGKGFDHHVGEEAVESLLSRGIAFDGMVAQSDQEAMGCMNNLLRRGLRIPEDVRLIGVDNSPYCEFVTVPLSSVSQNCRLQGEKAVAMLLAMIDGRPVRSATVSPLLVARQSSRKL